MNYTKDEHYLTNEEVFLAYMAGKSEAFNVLLGRFRNFIKGQIGKILASYDVGMLDFDDLDIIAQTAFNKAVNTYNVDDAPFAAYVTVVIKNALQNAIAKSQSPTERMVDYAKSFDEQAFAENSRLLLCDIVGEKDSFLDTENLTNHGIKHVSDLTRISFTAIEKKIVIAKMEGYTNAEIQAKLKLSKREYDKIISDFKNKVS